MMKNSKKLIVLALVLCLMGLVMAKTQISDLFIRVSKLYDSGGNLVVDLDNKTASFKEANISTLNVGSLNAQSISGGLNSPFTVTVSKEGANTVARWFNGSVIASGRDDSTIIQAAIDSVFNTGREGEVRLSPDDYNMSTKIILKRGVSLIGTGSTITQWQDHWGTTFNINSKITAIELDPATRLESITFYYPKQNRNSTPEVYPWTITLTGATIPADISIQHIRGVNPYDFIYLNSAYPNGRIFLNDIVGWPLHIGIYGDNGLDIYRFDRIIFTPNYAPGTGTFVGDWVYDNGAAIILARADGSAVINSFFFGYHVGIKFQGTHTSEFSHGMCDGCYLPVFIENSVGITIADNTLNGIETAIGTKPIWQSGQKGIYATGGSALVIYGNKIVSGGSGIVSSAQDSIISDNVILAFDAANSAYMRGIWNLGNYTTIDGNTIIGYGNSSQGILVSSSGVGVTNNVIKQCPRASIYILNGAKDFVVSGNRLIASPLMTDLSGSVNKDVSHWGIQIGSY